MTITPIGNHWYSLYDGGHTLEYNPGNNPIAQYHHDRKPLATVYRHINGTKVVAVIWGETETNFPYGNRSPEMAMKAAMGFVEKHFRKQYEQQDLFA